LRTYRGAFDQELFDKSAKAARDMWDRVQVGDPPPADGTDAYFDYLRAEYPGTPAPDRGGEASIRAVGFDVDQLADTLLETTDELKELEREQKRLRQRLCDETGNHDGLQGHGWRSTWRANKRGTRVFRMTREDTSDGG
jgi:predicted phage-related endonuclease